ncbi:MAG: YpdA family putative bacillithiol disulfide reductase [Ignavibacteria bacterium]|nr:YpdA family putative bacillithiol disulfide reductase [Ignavibacteria bacterium]
MSDKPQQVFDVIIVGAGPAGLSCAIEAKKSGLSAVILEKGSLVDYLRRFPVNVVWFSTPEMLEIGGVPFVTSSFRPGRIDTLNYYQRVTRHFGLDVRPFDAVEQVEKQKEWFRLTTAKGRTHYGKNVVVATGYFDHPNRLGIPGEDLPKVMHYYDEPYRYFDTDVAVVGGRNSAVEAALDLFRHGARVTLIHRGEELSDGVKYWILPDIRNRLAAGEIAGLFQSTLKEVRDGSISIQTPSGLTQRKNDFVFVLIGFKPDVTHLRRFGIRTDDDTLAPEHDEKSYETNLPGLFVAGSVVAGRFNNKIFVENGRLHGGSIIAAIVARS